MYEPNILLILFLSGFSIDNLSTVSFIFEMAIIILDSFCIASLHNGIFLVIIASVTFSLTSLISFFTFNLIQF